MYFKWLLGDVLPSAKKKGERAEYKSTPLSFAINCYAETNVIFCFPGSSCICKEHKPCNSSI